MNSKLKKALDITSWVAIGLFVVLVVLLIGVRLFGIEPHIVLSGSMEPEIRTGALVYVKELSIQEKQNLQVGDDVTFLVDKNGTKVTHRIYEVVGPAYIKNQNGDFVLDENGNKKIAKDDFGNDIYMYTTYGINNKNAGTESGYTLDGTLGVGNLASSNVIGKPVFNIPLLGYVANFVQNPPGQYVAIAACAILIFATFFGDKQKAVQQTAAPTPAPAPTENRTEEQTEEPKEEQTEE